MKKKVYVEGQEGTTGLRIHEMLAGRADLEVLKIDPDRRKDPVERARLLNAADVVFLCLPDAAAIEAAALVSNPQTCIIDASTAHRTVPGWTYGLPELVAGQRAQLRTAQRISNPGCHATAFILLVRPLVDAGLIPATLPLSATSITGYSGGGKQMIAQYTTSTDPRLNSPRPYALGLAHKHLPEMQHHSGLGAPPVFMPVVANFYQGLALSIPLPYSQLAAGTTGATLQQALAQHYAGEAFVKVLPLADPAVLAEGYLDVQALNHTNVAELLVFANATQALLIARLDNLGKGASGAAVQCLNLRLGVPEGTGL
jgi:N-acetyl-gamma-glutamyl-phosphate reductase